MYHFVANKDSKNRLIKMGEDPKKVFNVGCPSIDDLLIPDDPDCLVKRFTNLEKLLFFANILLQQSWNL